MTSVTGTPRPLAPRPVVPGFVRAGDRLAPFIKHELAPTWAGVPQVVFDGWVAAGRASVNFYNTAQKSALGRFAVNAVGSCVAGVWALVDHTAGLFYRKSKPPAPPTGPLPPALPAFSSSLSWLSTRGNQILDAQGQPVRLRGINLSGLESSSADPATPAMLDKLQAMGTNVLRLPINQGRALSDPAYVAELDVAAKRANARGIYVLFDMHWISGQQTATPDAGTVKMWRELASRYANQPGVLFDLHNEPGMIGWETNARWAEACIAAIRQVHPRSLVFVEGTNKGQRVAGALTRPIKAPNVVYEVHAYGPRQHGPGVGPAQWDALFGKLSERLPVFVGEFGGMPDEVGALAQLLKYCNQHNLGWAAWHCNDGDVFEKDGSLSPVGKLAARELAH